MDMILWIFQWVASIIGLGSICVLLVYCFKEFGHWGLAFLLFPPALLAYYAPTRWTKCKVPLILFLTCFAVAMLVPLFTSANNSPQTQERKQRSKQILTVNETIDKWNPGNGRLSSRLEVAKVKNAGFDFMKNRTLKEFEDLFSVAKSVSGADLMNINVVGSGIGKWISDQKPGTEYFLFETDLWNLGDGTETMDILIVACFEEKVTNWRLFAVCGY